MNYCLPKTSKLRNQENQQFPSRHQKSTDKTVSNSVKLSEREKQFLRLACSELTYNEVASWMRLSPKTIDGYRISVFEKLQVKSRVSMALYAVKHGLVKL